MMNLRFGKVMNWIDRLRTETANPRDGPLHRGPEGRRSVRQAISPLEESTIENTDEEANDFDLDHGTRIWKPRTYIHGGVWLHDYFGHKK
jgi:hypothetical protein